MYKLIIGAYQDFEKDFNFIQSDFIPRIGEIIDNYKVDVCDENDNIITFIQKLEVQSVHYELFKDNSCVPIVYANVIKCEKVKKEDNYDKCL